MTRIKMLRGVGYEGRSLDPGEVVEIDDAWAARFIAQGRAVEVTAPPAAAPELIAGADPEPETRDPKPRRARGARG